MSRYVHVAMGALTLDEVSAALFTLGLSHACGELMLEGSLECAGEPVAIRIEPAVVGAVEDLGFVVDDGTLRLVCGELDRARLEAGLVSKVLAEVGRARVRAAGERAGLSIEEQVAGVITVRRRS